LDRVLIEKIVAPTKSAGGVLLPESALPKVCKGDSSRTTALQINPLGQQSGQTRAIAVFEGSGT
jgi:co-chaperonin GroES (HSP10)